MIDVKRIALKSLWLEFKDYLNIRIEIFKLSALAKGSKLIADVLSSTFLFFMVMLNFLLCMVTFTFYLSSLFNSYAKGFGITALFFMILACLVVWKKDTFEKLFAGIVVKRYFNKHCINEQEIDAGDILVSKKQSKSLVRN
ncbi:hypothetical protein QG516_03970 [Pedobacter gandavensis]|uniref:hypothetical protein n=1 Tax=Pedobacter gandavensis TaxID=2679963 RepID=UPI00247A76B1|nr:hypothetical protein [Pedobacter gandavensis]WGQ10810.1 hypothetical protein QG516_03970 [Pedobacter gandavensis]